ncbi:MAG: hydroxyacid dehydrogenase [Thermodesulfobacteriota bacterium]|jgi:D-3-phosphoglycerate dehydrogenase
MQLKWKVFVSEPIDYRGLTHKVLENAGCEVIIGRPTWKYPSWKYSDDELIEACQDVDAVMGASRDSYTRKFMESVQRLRVIGKYGIGVEKIDIEAATDNGILVANTPVPENVHSVAEHAITLMLALCKKLRYATDYARQGYWRDQNVETRELFGKTIGIVGLGRIGRAQIARLSGWGVKFLAYDPYVREDDCRQAGASPVSLRELFEESDIVSVNVVITKETRKLIGKDFLKSMKKTAFIVNTSRGEVIDEKALTEALQKGWIAGAGLDVTDPEPPSSDNPLLNMENVIITPHIAGWTGESTNRITNTAANNVLSALKGEIPEFLVNTDAVSKWKERIRRIEETWRSNLS